MCRCRIGRLKTVWLWGCLFLEWTFPTLVSASSPVGGSPTPTPPDFSREPYVIELLDTSIRFEPDGTGTRTVRTRTLVQTEGALQELGQAVLNYNSDFERLSFKGRVIKPDGSKMEIPAGAIQDMSSPVSRVAPMYSDIRQKHVIVPGLRPGDVLEYELQFEQFAALAPGHFWTAYDFNRTDIVKDEELRIDVPASTFVNVTSLPDFKPEILEDKGRRIYRWKTANQHRDDDSVRKKKKEKPKSEPQTPAVQVTTFANWAQVGDWYAGLERDRRAPDDAIRTKVAELTKGLTDATEKLRAIYGYVAQEFRYVSLSFGMGRYQPHAAAEVFGNRYGDCKDKNTLLEAMADAASLRVRAALTSATRKIDPDFPSPLQFDHVISYLRLGDQDVWLDTTTELAPFRMIIAPVRKKHALVVAADAGSVLLQVPPDPVVPITQVTTVEGSLNDLGTLEADVRLAFRGDSEVVGRLMLRTIPQARWKSVIEYIAAASGVDGEISNVEIPTLTQVESPLEYRFHITKQNYFNRFEQEASLTLPFGSVTLNDPDDAENGKPLEMGKGRIEYHLKLRLPAQFETHNPLPVELKRDYAQYASRYALEGPTFTGERSLEVRVDELPADRRNDFQAFRRAVSADVDQRMPVKVGGKAETEGVSGGDSDEWLAAANAAYESGDYRASAELVERVLKSEPEHPSAFNDLGRAYLELHQFDKAEKALKKAVELNPFSPSAYTNLGRLYWVQRRYKDAEREFRKQIEIVPLDKWAHSNFGRMLAEQKRYIEAEPELQKAITITPDDARLYVELGSTQMSLKKPDKALESFDRAVELAPTPIAWNTVAYALAEQKIGLDRAQRYGESAVAMLTAQLRDVRLDQIKIVDLMNVNLLAASWDTLGWVHFRKGEISPALRYLNAAWQLAQDGDIADHLGRVYERAGKRDLAIEFYALAAAVPRAKPEGHEHLVALLGESDVSSRISKQRERLATLRTYDMPGSVGDGSAEFFVALAPGPRVSEVRFVSGDVKLKSLASSLKSIKFKMDFPDTGDARIIRRGILSCVAAEKQSATGACAFILLTPEDVRSVD